MSDLLDHVLVDSIGGRIMDTRYTCEDAFAAVDDWERAHPDQAGRYSVCALVLVQREGQ